MSETTPHTRAVRYLASIADGSAEDEIRIWFDNVALARRAEAFIKGEMRTCPFKEIVRSVDRGFTQTALRLWPVIWFLACLAIGSVIYG